MIQYSIVCLTVVMPYEGSIGLPSPVLTCSLLVRLCGGPSPVLTCSLLVRLCVGRT